MKRRFCCILVFIYIYGHLPPITTTIQVRQTRHAGHCCWSRDELISDVLLWTPKYGRAKAGRPARTYIQQLCDDTGCSPEDLPEARNDREKWWERVTTWWWHDMMMMMMIYIYIYMDRFFLIFQYCPSWHQCNWPNEAQALYSNLWRTWYPYPRKTLP